MALFAHPRLTAPRPQIGVRFTERRRARGLSAHAMLVASPGEALLPVVAKSAVPSLIAAPLAILLVAALHPSRRIRENHLSAVAPIRPMLLTLLVLFWLTADTGSSTSTISHGAALLLSRAVSASLVVMCAMKLRSSSVRSENFNLFASPTRTTSVLKCATRGWSIYAITFLAFFGAQTLPEMKVTIPELQNWVAGLALTTLNLLGLQDWAAGSDWFKILDMQPAAAASSSLILPGLSRAIASAAMMAPLLARAVIVAGTAISFPLILAWSAQKLVNGIARLFSRSTGITFSWDTGLGPEQLMFDTSGTTFATLEGSKAQKDKIRRRRIQWRAAVRRRNYNVLNHQRALGIESSPNPILTGFLENMQEDIDARIRQNNRSKLRDDYGIGDRDMWLETAKLRNAEDLEDCLKEESAIRAQYKEQTGWRMLASENGVFESPEAAAKRTARELNRLASLRKEAESLRPREVPYNTAELLNSREYEEIEKQDAVVSNFVVRYPLGRPLPEGVHSARDLGLDVWITAKQKRKTTASQGKSDVPSLFE